MNVMWTYPEWFERLAGSLMHFLWQGAFLAFAAAVLLRFLSRRSAASRYAVAVVCLGLMALAPCLTFIFYPETGGATLRVLQLLNRTVAEAGKSVGSGDVMLWTAWIVLGWAAGVSACGIRLLAGWILSCRLVQSAQIAIPSGVSQLMERLRIRLLGSRQVRLLIGERVDTPLVFGWLRPVILLPVAALTGLNENQLLAVLAHELSHVRRHDFLVNALQRGVESVLFYHPAVWWLSSRIRAEREHCCDDLAVQVCGDRFLYAEALIELERARAVEPALAIPAAAGRLGERIRRVLGVNSANRDWQPAAAALLLVAACALGGAWQTETIAATSLAAVPQRPPLAALQQLAPAVTEPVPSAQKPVRVDSPLNAIAAIVTSQTPQTLAPAAPEIAPARAAARKELGQLLVPYSAESFVKQAEEGDSIAVKLFLAAGMDPNVIASTKNEVGDVMTHATALIRASSAGQTETVKVLIAGHADVNLQVDWTPLAIAARNGHAETLKALLGAGAVVDFKNGDKTPLMWASSSGSVEAVKILLEKGADVRARTSAGTTALFFGAQQRNANAILPLLDAGADINARDDRGNTPLLNASLTNLDTIKLLLDKNADVNARDVTGTSMLLKVFNQYSGLTDSQRTDYIKLLVLRGADVNLSDKNGWTPLMAAAQLGSISAVKALLGNGANPNLTSSISPQTALKAAGNHTDIVQVLLDSGAK